MKTAVRAHEIATLLDGMPDIRCLSLDCFDTLIWRNAQMPRDIFAEIPLLGGGLEPRTHVESRVRDDHGVDVNRPFSTEYLASYARRSFMTLAPVSG